MKDRLDRNYWAGWQHYHGDCIVYHPKFPFKDEGMSFYTFYYEHLLRQEKIQGRAANNARVQYWSANKKIFEYDYANEVALEECEKRQIDVFLGWELKKVYRNEIGEKIGLFENVDTGKTIEKEFNQLVAHPDAHTQPELVGSSLVDENGLVDVNPYTLQHKKFENVFAFGSCTNLPTTRTQYATMAQAPIVKHNV